MTQPSTPPTERTPEASRVEMTQLVLPTFANNLGNIFGGQVLSWIDMCAAISAYRHARTAVVTASIDAVDFLLPIKVGHIVILRSQVNAVFRTSMECGVSIWSEDPQSGQRQKAMKAYTTYVSLTEEGKPQPIVPLVLKTEEDKRRSKQAFERRARRLDAIAEH